MLRKIGNNIIGDKMKIKEIIKNDFIIGNVNDKVSKIAKIMKENNIGFVPIEENKSIVGIVTDRDICINAISNKDIENKIKNYMKTSIIYIDEEKDIKDALYLMGKEKVKRLLVTRNDEVIGVLSLSDLLHVKEDELILKTIQSIFHTDKIQKQKEAEIDEFYL